MLKMYNTVGEQDPDDLLYPRIWSVEPVDFILSHEATWAKELSDSKSWKITQKNWVRWFLSVNAIGTKKLLLVQHT